MPDEIAEAARRPKLRYEDNPHLAETFADSIGPWFFDGQTLRIEFTVSRLDEAAVADKPTGRRHPACRLVLSMQGANELLALCRRLTAGLEKAAGAQAGAERGAAQPG
jgi:hypothetical protein